MYKSLLNGVAHHPSTFAGFLVFGLGFTLFTGNAVFNQSEVHPAPIWMTQEQKVNDSIVEKLAVAPQPRTINRNVLTQTISLKNIPVPMANPGRSIKNFKAPMVREVQGALAELGLYPGKVDGIYGSGTKQAIMNFQTSAGILPDGLATFELLNSLNATVSVSRSRAEVAPATMNNSIVSENITVADFDTQTVKRIQSGLKEKFGADEIDVDGVFGNQTRAAIRQFQEFFELKPSGEIDRQTFEKMLSAGIITAI
jgi:peptidoglycan hydrolase-like protein with peptidoglycan-binding domain